MNWTTFQTHNEAPEKAFETLCNQLFENWCYDEYKSIISSFDVVNGAGGDGGVESYATLNDGAVVGLQAKWFPNSITSGQITQIKNSIITAMKIRTNIKRYIVCVPRDIASITGKGKNNEAERLKKLWEEIKHLYPTLKLELWNETRLLTELQKKTSVGINNYWFSNSEISDDACQLAFEASKNSWLKTKYVSTLNTYGSIANKLSIFLGDYTKKYIFVDKINFAIMHCNMFCNAAEELIKIIKSSKLTLAKKLNENIQQVRKLSNICSKITQQVKSDFNYAEPVNIDLYMTNFDNILYEVKESNCSSLHYFHTNDVIKELHQLSQINFQGLFNEYNDSLNRLPIIILGEPGTGKTQGVAAYAEKLLTENHHTTILIAARNVPCTFTWKDIIISTLKLSSNWSEDALWQELISMVNRHKFNKNSINSEIKITPKILIVVDALDECGPYSRWIERIHESAIISEKYPQIKFCFTSRPHVIPDKFANIKRITVDYNGDVPVDKLFDSYIHAYNVKAENHGWLKYALNTPLTLKLFCELNENKTVSCSKNADVSLTSLLRSKIKLIEEEYCAKESVATENQYILKTITAIAKNYLKVHQIERANLISLVSEAIDVARETAEKILQYLENYGILSSVCEHGKGLEPDNYYYIPGIQGYFDYAMAISLLSGYSHPKEINFEKCVAIESEAIYVLTVISMQKYDYLLTQNKTILSAVHEWEIEDLNFYALRHTSHDNGLIYKNGLLEMMSVDANNLIKITNNLILPLSRDTEHPLGVKLLDEFLFSFKTPAQRDLYWSIPGYLNRSEGTKWYTEDTLHISTDEFALSADDICDGRPTIYTWALSSVNNKVRKYSRDSLMSWAKLAPTEFFKLFIKFSDINDPQIRSDIFSVLCCLIFDGASNKLIEDTAIWMIENVLKGDNIYKNSYISIRYYAIAILKKAILSELLSEEKINPYMPPYFADDYNIELSKEALAGERMSGYSAIDYDLARYVLVDNLEYKFTNYSLDSDQFNNLINKITERYPDFKDIRIDQFIISAAYAYIVKMGWTEKDFWFLEETKTEKENVSGLDLAIRGRYSHATHGEQSDVMTVCEKYIWQFRNYMNGFLADRLIYLGDNEPVRITDYGILDDFIIPVQELEVDDPNNLPEDRPWYIPEKENVILNCVNKSREDVINNILDSPDLNWEKWISIDNSMKQYRIDGNKLLALNGYSCFFGSGGVETSIFINSVIINEDEKKIFLDSVEAESPFAHRIANPVDWRGHIESFCYITPKEVCWFPWKKRFDSQLCSEVSASSIHSAVDECCYNSLEFGDVYYKLPSAPVRFLLNIVDSNGYMFYDNSKKIKALFSQAGEKWSTFQDYLLVDKDEMMKVLHNNHKTLIWILREIRREDGKSRERFGEFYAEKDKSYIGYLDKSKFCIEQIYSKFNQLIDL